MTTISLKINSKSITVSVSFDGTAKVGSKSYSSIAAVLDEYGIDADAWWEAAQEHTVQHMDSCELLLRTEERHPGENGIYEANAVDIDGNRCRCEWEDGEGDDWYPSNVVYLETV
jgi:hypothetical protein